MRLLILGGTTEASALARRLAARDLAARRDGERHDTRPLLEPLLSLAGRTDNPAVPPIPYRVGGFGGAEGLADFLRAETIAALVDATHPFAARISANAARACAAAGVPRAILTRAPWRARDGDDWRPVPDLDAAAAALGSAPARVFLTSGRLGLAAFKRAPQHHYLVRSIDPPAEADRPPLCDVVLGRGPFDEADETALMRRHGIAVLVSKNSGGDPAKLDAARALALPVVMVERPGLPERSVFTDVEAVLGWIEAQGLRLRP